MKADAIIFDKDGTLIDFDAFWVNVSFKAIEDVLKRFGTENVSVSEILEAFGVRDGVTDINGVLCKGTYAQMGRIVYDIVKEHGECPSCEEVTEAVISAYNKNADAGVVKPTCPDLVGVLTELKKQNKKLAVVTTDNELITRKCLKALGVEDLFDKIYTDDGKLPTKPNPDCVFDFCGLTGVKKERVIMVGDTITDMRFAKNAGIAAVGLAKDDRSKVALAPYAYAVISEISRLLDILE